MVAAGAEKQPSFFCCHRLTAWLCHGRLILTLQTLSLFDFYVQSAFVPWDPCLICAWVCERGEVFVLRSFCYFKNRNRLEPSEKAASSYNTRCIYCWVKKKNNQDYWCKTTSLCLGRQNLFVLSHSERLLLWGRKEIQNGEKVVCLNGS